ncbi:MAG TPA: TIGR00730 family Rossman fold protein, partial [Planctomycetota bacterium]|nr:TIGR00730 family Rossman fold protein [Planctomycetota bacterium]
MKSACVFCGSSAGKRPAYSEAARALGRHLAARGVRLVFGGGRVGLMGVVADAVLEAGGTVTGVIPRALATRELAHDGLTDLRVVGTMHERKALMAELSDAFIALPGGLGTLEEFCEIVTWAQLGIHQKPCGILDVEGYYAPLLVQLDHAVAESFVKPQHRALVLSESDPARLLDALAAYHPP